MKIGNVGWLAKGDHDGGTLYSRGYHDIKSQPKMTGTAVDFKFVPGEQEVADVKDISGTEEETDGDELN